MRPDRSPRNGILALQSLYRPILPCLAVILLATACAGGEALPPAGNPSALLEYRSGIDLSGRPGMGGLSGLHVSDDGTRMTAISDYGRVLTGPLHHNSAGVLTDWTVESDSLLPGLSEAAGKRDRDAEALARQADGSWLVTFEGRHRILRFPAGTNRPEGQPRPIDVPDSIARLPANKGIEALAVRPDGTLVAFAEAVETEDGQHRLYLRTGDKWIEKRYRTAPFFSPSDAAALPDGDILVLDRGYSLLGGIRTRLLRIPSKALLADAIVEGVLIGEIEPPIGVDNFEGLSIRRDDKGGYLLYLISDDNFSPLQRTLLVQYVMRESRAN